MPLKFLGHVDILSGDLCLKRLISQTEMPKRNDYSVAEFNVVFYNDAIGNVVDLLLPFIAPTNLKSIIIDNEVRFP